jgi:hypothetical protein
MPGQRSSRMIRPAALLRLSFFSLFALLSLSAQVLAAPPDTMPIWRVQVYFQTFNTEDAGSDDDVVVELRGGNATWIDSDRDDFEVSNPRAYDLRMEGISRLQDIDYLRISKTGSDGWCLGRIQLRVNGVPIYDQRFPRGLWLDSSSGQSRVFYIDDYFMRQRTNWINYVQPTRSNIVPVHDIRLRIEALLGDFLHNAGSLMFARYGDYSVELYTLNVNTWHVDLDLENDKQWPFPNTDVDVDFDLSVTCSGGIFTRPNFTVTNLVVDAPWPADEGGVSNFLVNNFSPRMNEMMKNYSYWQCPGIQLSTNGDLNFLPVYIDPLPPIVLDPTP